MPDALTRATFAVLALNLDHARCHAGQVGLHDLARDIVSLVVKYKLPAAYDAPDDAVPSDDRHALFDVFIAHTKDDPAETLRVDALDNHEASRIGANRYERKYGIRECHVFSVKRVEP